MRKLASIQRIWKVEPIEGADHIELAHVLGWQCVVNKGQFQPMDTAVYFEIDSFLPIRDEFEFLRTSSYKKTDIMGEGFRLRTLRFRGQISQGLLLPTSLFPEIPKDANVGTDVTELLGVRKWEIEERATTGGTVIGALPYSMSKDAIKIYKQSHAVIWVGDGSDISNLKIQRAYNALSIKEQNAEAALTNRLCLVYNKFSNKSSKTVGDIKMQRVFQTAWLQFQMARNGDLLIQQETWLLIISSTVEITLILRGAAWLKQVKELHGN